MPHTRQAQSGFSLIELLTVILVIGTLAAMAVPLINPGLVAQLESAAHIAAADFDYARELAVTFNSQYRVTLDPRQNRFVISHAGSDSTLDALPPSAFRSPDDPPDQHIVRLDRLCGISEPVSLYGSYAISESVGTAGEVIQLLNKIGAGETDTVGTSLLPIGHVEFGPLGQTSEPHTAVIWLSAGRGQGLRYISLIVNPVTGITSVGPLQSTRPALPAVASDADSL